MSYIATTFAHGNGPYSRCVDWAIEVNSYREERGKRLPIVVPLVYPGRQERIMQEEIGKEFITNHPDEILFDKKHGELLAKLMFKGNDYSENLRQLAEQYATVEAEVQRHLEGKRELQTFDGRTLELDLRDAELQLGLNNRMHTGLPNQFYTAGGAGPFDEILERAIADKEVKLDKEAMKKVLPIARRMIENQRVIFSNEPGVFSYDGSRIPRSNEMLTPPFIHFPKQDYTKLPGKGIYLLMTGIDGVRESGMYDAISQLGMHLFAPEFTIKSLPEAIRNKAIPLAPSQLNNPDVVCQYARSGWSSVWLSHLAKKGFITPKHDERDDPEILFNQRGIVNLGLGTVIEDEPRKAVEKAISLAENTKEFNGKLLSNYGILDGIVYAAKFVAKEMRY